MGAAEIRRKLATGAALVTVRGIVVRIIGLVGSIALARLLVPSEFGMLAFGLSLLVFASLVADGGLGASLIRRPAPPEVADLRAVLALQIGGAMCIAVPAATAGFLIGGVGTLTAVMILALPIMALRGPGMIVLERRLAFGPVALVEIGEVLTYYAWGIAMIALGFGVVGFATASIARAVVGTAALLRFTPADMWLPYASRARIRALLSFGLRFQGVQVVGAAREHGLNVGTAAIAGFSTLGLWVLATRLLQIPLLLFESLWRVSFPGMGQLIGAGEDPRPIMERGTAMAAAASGVLVTVVASAGPALVPVVFGSDWAHAAVALPAACLGLQINGPMSSAVAGFLFATDRAGTVLQASMAGLAASFAVSFSLLPSLGVLALGLGYLSTSVVETAVFTRAARRVAGARLIRPLSLPLTCAIIGSSCGWLFASSLDPNLLIAAAAALLGTSIYGVAMLLVQRAVVVDLIRTARRGLGREGATASVTDAQQ